MVPVVVVSLPFLYMLGRKRILRRLAIRNAVRRPRETALVLLGAMLGTAIITSSYVVGDTLRSSIRRGAYTQLGPVDETVAGDGSAVGAQVMAALAKRPPAGTAGALSLLTVGATVFRGGASPKAEPHSRVLEVDFARARAFGGDPAATGISGATPAGDEAAIGTDLAQTLSVKVGDTVTVSLYGQQRTLRVKQVLPRLGMAGFMGEGPGGAFVGGGSTSPNLFVAPGTIDRMYGASAGRGGGPPGTGEASAAAPPTSVVAVSNGAGVLGGVAASDRIKSELQAAVVGLPVSVEAAKKDLLKAADVQGKSFTDLFRSFGMFSVLAGVLLLVNIFVMLAQERKTELGMLRAIGLRRNRLVGSFSLEGWLYALASSLVGAVVGLGIGRVIVIVASSIFRSGGNNLELHFAATTASLQTAFFLGFAISLVTVVATSLSIARLNVIRAIRDLPEPPSARTSRISQALGGVGVVAGLAITVSGIAGGNGVPALAGPAVLGLGVVPVLSRSLDRRALVSVVSALVLAWGVVCFSILRGAFQKSGIAVFVIQGVVLTGSAVALVSYNQSTIGNTLRRLGGGARNLSLRLGLAYPLARRLRTGLILSMYALVVFTLTFMIVLSHLFGGQVKDVTQRVSGGAALRVVSNASDPVPADRVRTLAGVTHVAPVVDLGAEFSGRLSGGEFRAWTVSGFDESLIGHGAPKLHTRAAGFATDADLYRAVASDPSKMITSEFFLQRQGGPARGGPKIGDRVVVRSPLSGQAAPVTIVGITESGFGGGGDRRVGDPGTLVSHTLTSRLFGSRAVPNLLYVSTASGTDNDKLATTLSGSFLLNGADARSFHSIVTGGLATQQRFFQLIKGYVALGLIVGIAGLGVVMVRAVRERRREVGVLRSLGFSAIAIRRAFLAESSFVALEGILLGTSLALVTAWRLIGAGTLGTKLGFSVPWAQLLVLVAGTFAASLVATAVPAQQASRIRPAVALRIAD